MMRSKVIYFVVALSIVTSLPGISQAVFLNDTVSGLQLWLKADAGVVVNGSNGVTAWADQSLNTTGAVTPASGREPLLTTAVIGGNTMDVLRFDGVNDDMTTSPDMIEAVELAES